MDDGDDGELLAQLLAKVDRLEAANEHLADKLRTLETGVAVRAPVGRVDELDDTVSRLVVN